MHGFTQTILKAELWLPVYQSLCARWVNAVAAIMTFAIGHEFKLRFIFAGFGADLIEHAANRFDELEIGPLSPSAE